ncbi:MAG TPA: hypothetical protein PKG95_15000, partial [Anaerolineaceae bacterium]|nr:hypothetical protein [Anaerolineaceae bacterium]
VYTAGTGLALTGNEFSVTGAPWDGLTDVPAGIADGIDNDTTYTAGVGLALNGTQINFGLTNLIIVDAGGKGHYTSLVDAVAAAPEGTTILVMPGTYSGSIGLAQDNIHIIGSGAGEFDSVSGSLVGGTIIQGYINMADSYGSSVSNLGVDVHSLSTVNGIDTGSTVASEQHRLDQRISNVTILGDVDATSQHGIRIQGGSHVQIDNVRAYQMAHGIAVRGSYVNINDVHAEDMIQTAVIVKAAAGTLDAQYVNISNVVAINTGPVMVEATNGYTAGYVNIANVTMDTPFSIAVLVSEVAGSTIQGVNISNVTVYGSNAPAANGVFEVRNASQVSFSNIQSFDPTTTSILVYNNGGSNIKVTGAYAYPTDQYLSGLFDYAQTNASEQFRVHSVSGFASYDVTLDNRIIEVSAQSGDVTINLPDAAQCRGCIYLIKKVNTTNTVTIDPYGSTQNIDGAATYSLSAQWSMVEIVSDGNTWLITGQ